MLIGDISTSNKTKGNFFLVVYELDKSERIFFWICFCSTIVYARSLILMLVLMSMFMPHTSLRFFGLSFVLTFALGFCVDRDVSHLYYG